MLNYLKKFAMEILPSVAATIIGAYIVNHYIAAKPGSQAPVAATVSTAQPKSDAKSDAKADTKADIKATGDVANLPEAGVKARGISEKALLEKNAAAEKAVVEKPAEKAADKPTETASIPAETRRHTPAPREKTAVRVIPLTPAQPAPAPVAAAPASTPATEAAAVPEERRDANDLARAAIDRLRGTDGAPRSKEARAPETPRIETPRIETPRIPEVARVSDAPHIEPALRPLPPPIMVSTPPADPANARIVDPQRPTPPAEIPAMRPPLDLRAEITEPKREKTSVAEDVLSAAKSVFHSVLPK